MLKIFTEEGEVVIVLTNVEMMNEGEFFDKMFGELSEDEGDIVGEFVLEGVVVKDEDEIDNLEVREMTFEEYIDELKMNCEKILNDE